MSRIIDYILQLLKWPIAILSFISLPALYQAISHFSFNNTYFLAFLAGTIVYILLKIIAAARSNVSMQILAHEFTHIFFAWLTFHKVVHIHLNFDESGGAMGFKGKGNWLIVIAPYFFPLFLFFVILALTFYSENLPNTYWINGILGYLFAYHIEMIATETHANQPDFKEVGYPFCWLFLPGANLFICSVILAFNNGGWTNVLRYLKILTSLISNQINFLLSYLTN